MGKGVGLITVVLVAILAFWAGSRTQDDPNAVPRFGKTGLPSNCRALVQIAVDGWKSKVYSTEATMASLERNCGADGQLWAYEAK